MNSSDQGFESPNPGRQRMPSQVFPRAATIQSKLCKLVEATLETNAPILQTKAIHESNCIGRAPIVAAV
jgi:hypothetical protein